jgi:DNA-binding IclR family transcriptional regulator
LSNLDLREAAAPLLHKIALETASTALLVLISGRHAFVVAKDEGVQQIGLTIKLGHRFPVSWGAHGKSIVAFLPEAEKERILGEEKLYFHGDPSRFEPERLSKELARCRQTGFAVDPGDMQAGIHAVASPLFDRGERVIGSILVVGTFPLEMSETYGFRVARAARELSESMGRSFPSGSLRSAREDSG